MGVKDRIADFLLNHPTVDIILPFLSSIILPFKCSKTIYEQKDNDFFIGVSTLGALVMATATFVCALMYQSNGAIITIVRKRYGDILAHNWLNVIGWTLLGAVLPLGSILIRMYARLAFGIALFSLVIIIEKGVRSLFWLKLVFLIQNTSEHIKKPFTEKDWKEMH